MIRSRVEALRRKKAYEEGTLNPIPLRKIAEATGLSESTLSKLNSDTSTRIDYATLDVLCSYFGCNPGDLIEHVADIPGTNRITHNSVNFGSGNGLTIAIKTDTPDLTRQQLWTKATAALIEAAAVSRWEREGTSGQGIAFYADILDALLRSYAQEIDTITVENRLRHSSKQEVLADLLAWYGQKQQRP